MRNIIWILFVAVLTSCQDVTIGFLNIERPVMKLIHWR